MYVVNRQEFGEKRQRSSRRLNRFSSKCKYRALPLWEHVWRRFGDAGFESLLGTSSFHTPSFPYSLQVISLLGVFYEVLETTTSALWSTQPLMEMRIRDISCWVKAAGA